MSADGGSTPQERIVVGVDGSPQSRHALRWAVGMARLTRCEVEAVFAWDDPQTEAYVPGWGYRSAGVDPVAAAENYLACSVDDTFKGNRPDFLSTITIQGAPAKVLTERSRDARMLVLGSRGHGGFVGLLLGSVSAKCAEHAKCPVLVVHGTVGPPGPAAETPGREYAKALLDPDRVH